MTTPAARFGRWLLIIAFASLAIPTANSRFKAEWSGETGLGSAIVLASAAWLLWTRRSELQSATRDGNPFVIVLVLTVALVSYVAGHAYDVITLELVGLYGVGVAMAYNAIGSGVLARNWFLFAYPALAIPPPGWLLIMTTLPLKQFVSFAAVSALHTLDFPISREGVSIYIAQYQLLVSDACAGMNSITSLIGLGLFYTYLVRPLTLGRALLMAAVAVPIAIVANIVRVIVLILITYYLGDEAAQGYLHFAAGVILFSVALLMVYAFETLLAYQLTRPGQRA